MKRVWSATVGVALVGTVLALPVATPAAAAPTPVPPKHERVSLVVASADSRSVQTSRETSPFRLAAVTWAGQVDHDAIEVQLRTRADGRWGEWVELHSEPGETPDPDTDEGRRVALRGGTEPLLAPGSDAVQVRVSTDRGRLPKDMRVELVDPGSSPADAAMSPQPVSTAAAQASTPSIISRAQWGADESLRTDAPTYMSTIKTGFVHHTASSNSYWQKSGWTMADAAKDIRAVYAYSVNSRGYADIPYNFLVDQAGRIYEGRAGGVDKPVRSGATGGFNTDTFAISALGNLHEASPTSAMVSGIAAIAAWKLDLHHRDPLGTTVLTSAGGGTSMYAAGVKVTVPVLAGHRDVGSTACPGQYLYPQLAAIRTKARTLIGAALFNPTLDAASGVAGSAVARIRATSSVAQTWTLTVRSLCTDRVVRTWTGSAGSGAWLIPWNGTTDAGASAGVGRFRLDLTARSSTSVARPLQYQFDVLPASGAPLACPHVVRVGGADRWATSVALGRAAAPSATTVVLVSGETANLVDGLVAAPLARRLGAPVLVTLNTALPAPVRDDLVARGVTDAVLIGAVGPQVASQLSELGITSRRIAGSDRYQTAALVAREFGTSTAAVFASGATSHLVDALAASGVAAAAGRPILLVTRDTVPQPTSNALADLGVTAGSVLGGESVISEAVRTSLPRTARLAGNDRYETATVIATAFGFAVPQDRAVLSSGADANLVDALSAGALGQAMVLAAPTTLPAVSAGWLANGPSRLVVAGGSGALGDGVLLAAARSTA